MEINMLNALPGDIRNQKTPVIQSLYSLGRQFAAGVYKQKKIVKFELANIATSRQNWHF